MIQNNLDCLIAGYETKVKSNVWEQRPQIGSIFGVSDSEICWGPSLSLTEH